MSRRFVVCIATALFVSGGGAVFAQQSDWAKDHPRRVEVNQRLRNQNQRIHQEVKGGEMTKAEARRLHQQDRSIHQEERDMAKMNGGHISKQEKRTLNQQENQVSREIGK